MTIRSKFHDQDAATDADNVHVRPARRCELGQVAALHAQCFAAPWQVSMWETYFDRKAGHVLVAVSHRTDAILGILLANEVEGEAEILTLSVAPCARRCGVARRLLSSLIQSIAVRPCRLFLEVGVDNQAALALYRDAGFDTVGRRAAYYRLPDGATVDALIMAMQFDE